MKFHFFYFNIIFCVCFSTSVFAFGPARLKFPGNGSISQHTFCQAIESNDLGTLESALQNPAQAAKLLSGTCDCGDSKVTSLTNAIECTEFDHWEEDGIYEVVRFFSNAATIKLLTDHGAKPTEDNLNTVCSEPHEYMRPDRIKIIDILVGAGAPITPNVLSNAVHFPYGPIFDDFAQSTITDHISVVKELIALGAPVNGDAKIKPLRQVTEKDVAELLIKAGADFHINDLTGGNVIHSIFGAVTVGQVKGYPSFVTQEIPDLIRYYVGLGLSVESRDNAGKTVLFETLYHDDENPNLLKLMIDELSANVNAEDNSGETPLMIEFERYGNNKSSSEGIRLLYSRVSSVNIKNSTGDTLLTMALQKHDANLENLIFTNPRDIEVNTINNNGSSAFILALENNAAASALSLAKIGANIKVRTKGGDSGMEVGARNHSMDLIEVMIRDGFSINDRGANLDTPLITAVKAMDTAMAGGLILRNADVNLANSDKRTALMEAVINSDTVTTVLLLKNGALQSQVDTSGKTVWAYALESGNMEIQSLLKMYSLKDSRSRSLLAK